MRLLSTGARRVKLLAVTLAALLVATLSACMSDADQAGYNLSREAESFQVARRIVFYNGITDTYMLQVEGLCSVDPAEALKNTIAVTCKEGPNDFVKHYLGRSDNVTFFAEQLHGVDVSTMHTKIIWKPAAIVPDIDVDVVD